MSKIISLLASLALIAMMAGCASSSATSSAKESKSSVSSISAAVSSSSDSTKTGVTADTVFGYPEQKKASSGSGSNIGTIAVFHADSSDCTIENLETWCNQYVRWGLDNWCVILYTDKPGYGVYANESFVDANVEIDNDYMEGDDSEATFYIFSSDDVISDGKLTQK